MLKIGFFCSGDLGLFSLLTIKDGIKPSFIATDSKSEGIIEYARSKNTPLFRGNPRNGRLSSFLKGESFDLFLSINYLFILESDIISLANHSVNLHGSLLPKYRGRTPHVWAIINNESKTGVTAHFMDEKCDTGAIILQNEIEIDFDDTGATILSKFKNVYPEIIDEIIERTTENNLFGKDQDNAFATYFGKRTPDDGLINWDWQKERIRNWVRAQTSPYPGAFTFYQGEKIIVDEIEYSNLGFNSSNPNGMILSIFPVVIVKTQNGAIALKKARHFDSKLNIGDILK